MENLTYFEKWNNGTIANLGSFDTTLMQCYRIADSTNRAKMELMYPDYFGMNGRKKDTIVSILTANLAQSFECGVMAQKEFQDMECDEMAELGMGEMIELNNTANEIFNTIFTII